MDAYQREVIERIEERFPKEDVEKFEEILKVMSKELMPEIKI